MIESWIKNDLRLKQWRRFKANRMAVLSSILLLLITFFSLTAELWSNSKPLILKFNGTYYFPVVAKYHPTVFGVQGEMVTNYRALPKHEGDWTLWPVNPWDPYESNSNIDSYPGNPTSLNKMGTDDRGRDIFSRLLYGYRYSMAYAVLVWLLTTVVAIILGGMMGYLGGWVDIIGQRFTEVISSMPILLILITLISIFNPGIFLLVVLTAFFGWIFLSYYIRGEFLKNRKKEFVEAARALGASTPRIIFIHVLPNSLGPVITFAPFLIAGYISSLAGLDYLGYGLQPPTPSWGELLNQAQSYFRLAWWLAFWPSVAVMGTLVLLSLIGKGVRDALDPRA